MFLGFQYPVAVPGVSVANFLRAALGARRGEEVPVREFRQLLMDGFEKLGVRKDFAGRYLNDGFSGGEKKRLEILQMHLLQPSFALLDETDSGLDIDALKIVSEGVNLASRPDNAILLVTHYQRILDYVKPDVVHVFMDGRIVRTGGPELAVELEARGYDWISRRDHCRRQRELRTMSASRIEDLNLDYKAKYGFSDPEEFLMKAPKGLSHEVVEMISRYKNEPDWMREYRHEALDIFYAKPMPRWGNSALLDAIDFDDIHYYLKSSAGSANDWDDVPENIKNTFDRLGIPEAEQKFLAGVTAQYESEVVYHSMHEAVAKQGVIFTRHGHGAARAPGDRQEVLGHGDPAAGQQVRRAQQRGLVGRLVHLRAAQHQGGDPAAGLLPHQRREHGPVRADPDHRRRGQLGALHRGLHGAGLLHQQPALGGGRAGGAQGRPHPLHHHPELVQQHLQPGDQAGPRPRGRGHRVGGRQHRLQADHEVPGGLPVGRARPRRGALHRLRRRRPAPGRRRQDDPRGAPTPRAASSASPSARAPAAPATAAWSRCSRARPTAGPASSATRC